MPIVLEDLPYELRENVFVWYRVVIRKRMAQRRLQRTRTKSVQQELRNRFAFCLGDYKRVLYFRKGNV
jgi:hypothetical protein